MTLEFHPLADALPLMDDIELRELAGDISQNGQIEPIVLLDGKILDGRNRALACKLAGIEPETVEFDFAKVNRTPREFVLSANVWRRHLTGIQKRELITKLLKEDPSKSNRQIADIAKVDHKTVGDVRQKQEQVGTIPQLPKTTGRDGRQRTTKPRRQRPAKPKATETGEKVIHLSSRIEELVNKWHSDGKPDVWFRVHDEYGFKVMQLKPLVDPKTQTGQKVREGTAQQHKEGTFKYDGTRKSNP